MLSNLVEQLEKTVASLQSKVTQLEIDLATEKSKNKVLEDTFKNGMPVKIMYHKSRRNTTVKFMDGSSVTVKLKKGERHCLETALAYALMKHIYPTSLIKLLIKEVEYTDIKESK